MKDLLRMSLEDMTAEANFPTLRVGLSDGKTLGYLTPFRGYRFQVSGNIKGESDIGSTTVCALKDLTSGMMGDLAELAVYKAAGNYTDIRQENSESPDEVQLIYGRLNFQVKQVLYKWIDEVVMPYLSSHY